MRAACCSHPRSRGARLVHRRLGGLSVIAVDLTERTQAGPELRDEPLPRRLDAADAGPRNAHGRHPDRGGAAERHRVLRLDLADRDRRRADAAALDRRNAGGGRGAAVRRPDRRRCSGRRRRSGSRSSSSTRSSSSAGRTGSTITSRSWSAPRRRPRTRTRRRPRRMPSASARLCEVAGRHFNRGQRAFFFALGYLGWFISPWLLMVTSIASRGAVAAPVRVGFAPRAVR